MRKTLQRLTNLKIHFVFFLFIIFTGLADGQVVNPRALPNEWSGYGIGDPYILKYRGKYYLYCSTRDDTVGVKTWSSWDLASWNYEGLASTDPITKGAYAPEVIYYNGMFYMYTSPAGNGHYILSSNSPTGPFTVQTGNLGHSIDGDVLVDDDGKLYFTHAGGSGILGNTMSGPLAIDGADQAVNGYLNGWTEGSMIFKRDGLYYLTYTGNHVFSPGYRVAYGTSTSPLGPYTAANNDPVILNSEGSFYGLGHSGSVIGPDLDTWYIAYHNLLGHGTIGPLRKLNIDPQGFNGTKMVVYGPTNWSQPTPSLPTFYDRFDRTTIGSSWTNVNGGNWGIYNQELMWQNQTGTSQWYRQVSSQSSSSDYTVEFNMKEVGRGGNDARFGAVFSYTDESNFGSAVFSSYDNTLEVNFIVNGSSTGIQTYALFPGWDYQKWHALRVEKHNTTFKVYVDGMLKSTTQVTGLGAGKIGVTTMDDHADFGYTAFSNHSDGSAVFDFYKPIPGTIESVHYNSGGEGVGYHDITSGNTGGIYRNDNVDIRACPEGGNNIGWNSTGEWYKYNVNIQSNGFYHIGLRYATTFTTAKVRFWCDGVDISGIVSLPATGDWNNWQTQIIKKVSLPAGYHTLKMETVEGEFDFYTIRFETAADVVSTADNFDSGFSAGWNYSDGSWSTTSGTATINGWGKRTMGNVGWSDYSVEADIQCPSSGNAGLIFRVRNPANGGANNNPQLGADFYQGYYAGIQTNGIQLGKQNYDWTGLNFKSQTLNAGQWYKVKAVMHEDTIKVYLDDMVNPLITYIDTNPFISGKGGLRAFNTQVTFDNFQINGDNNQKPVVSITSPANNATFNAPASLTIQATASDLDGSIRKVEFFNGSTSLGTDDISLYSFNWNNVSAGTYTITAVATDNFGTTTTSSAITINVNQPPTVSITSPVNNSSFNAPASVSIQATAGDTDGSITQVEFFNGSTSIGTDVTSPYSVNWNSVPSGTYTITAVATDNSGTTTTSSAITINVNQPPTVSITSPVNNSSFNAPASVSIQATAGDTDGSITQVEFFNGSTSIGTDVTSPYSINWNSVPSGTYTITAVATDNSGATTTSSAITILVNQPPAVSITSPADNASFNAPASVTIQANASDTDGTITQVEFFNGSTSLGTDDISPYSFNWNNVSAGTYTFTVVATDNSGATTTSSAITVIVNQPPTVSITSPADNASFNAPASVTIQANASDTDGTITQVEFFNASTSLGVDATSPYSVNWNSISSGTYTITAVATDNSGATTTSSAILIVVDQVNQAPIVSITSPANNETFNVPADVTINADASDSDGSVVKVEFYEGTNLLGEDNTSPYSFVWIGVSAGTYNVYAIATDDQGATASSTSVSITINQNTATGISKGSYSTPAIVIAPNPVVQELKLYSDMDLSSGKVRIINSLGVTVMETSYTNQSIEVSSLASGAYTLIFIKGNNQVIKQFVK